MKLKTFIFLLFVGGIGYFGFVFISENYNQPAMAYKRYVEALMKGDSSTAKHLVADEKALRPFGAHEERMSRIGGEPRFTWFDFRSHVRSEDDKTATLVVKFIVRYDPPGEDSYFGTEVWRDQHIVTLVKDQSSWKVLSFEDSASAASSQQARYSYR